VVSADARPDGGAHHRREIVGGLALTEVQAIFSADGIKLLTLPERVVPLSVALQSTLALPLASITTLDSVTVAFDTGNGARTADAAPPGGDIEEFPNMFWMSAVAT
jgi:hypothetical protein